MQLIEHSHLDDPSSPYTGRALGTSWGQESDVAARSSPPLWSSSSLRTSTAKLPSRKSGARLVKVAPSKRLEVRHKADVVEATEVDEEVTPPRPAPRPPEF